MRKLLFFVLVTFPLAFCTCPKGEHEYQSNCYYLNATQTVFAAAEITCEHVGCYTLSFRNSFTHALLGQEAQNYFLENSVTGFLIGANNFDPLYQKCSYGWFYFAPTHSCYGITFEGYKTTWTAAQTFCANFGETLSSVNTFSEFQLLTTFLYSMGDGIWTDVFSVDGGKTWKTNDASVADFLKYGNWCEDCPSYELGQRCVIVGSDSNNGCYRDLDCNIAQRNVLCKKTIT